MSLASAPVETPVAPEPVVEEPVETAFNSETSPESTEEEDEVASAIPATETADESPAEEQPRKGSIFNFAGAKAGA